MNAGGLNIVAILLTAAAVLAWPGAGPGVDPLEVVRSGRVPAPAGRGRGIREGRGSDIAVSDIGYVRDVRDTVTAMAPGAETGARRSVVPVAEVAGVIDLLALTLRGGVGLVEAMEAVADRVGGPLGLHLRTVAAAGRWGVEDATAWASVPSAWRPAARALRMAASAGVPPADALAGAAEEVRRAERQRLEVATATLGVRIVLPLGLLFLPAFILTTVVPIVIALAQNVLSGR